MSSNLLLPLYEDRKYHQDAETDPSTSTAPLGQTTGQDVDPSWVAITGDYLVYWIYITTNVLCRKPVNFVLHNIGLGKYANGPAPALQSVSGMREDFYTWVHNK